MTKLNQRGISPVQKAIQVAETAVTHNGATVLRKNDLQQVFEILTGSLFGRDNYYDTNHQKVIQLRGALTNCIANGQVEFVLRCIHMAKNRFRMRVFPIVAAVETLRIMHQHQVTHAKAADLIEGVIVRADEPMDMFAYALAVFGDKKHMPKALKKGIARSFEKFDAYQLSKYNKDNAVKMKDVLKVVRPAPKDEAQSKAFKGVIDGTIAPAVTWETQFSDNGRKPLGERKQDIQIWEELFDQRKIGYKAAIMNLRNMMEAGLNNNKALLQKWCDLISNAGALYKSGVFPYTIYYAKHVIENGGSIKRGNKVEYKQPMVLHQDVFAAMNMALENSVRNVPFLPEDMTILLDTSSSMGNPRYNRFEDGTYPAVRILPFVASIIKRQHLDGKVSNIIGFDSHGHRIRLDTAKSMTELMKDILACFNGGATILSGAYELMKRENMRPETLLLVSDMQVNQCYGYGMGTAAAIEKMVPDSVHTKFAMNLGAYQASPATETNGWNQLSGYSDTVFEFMSAYMMGRNLEDIILKYQF